MEIDRSFFWKIRKLKGNFQKKAKFSGKNRKIGNPRKIRKFRKKMKIKKFGKNEKSVKRKKIKFWKLGKKSGNFFIPSINPCARY